MKLINEYYEGVDISQSEKLSLYFFEYVVNPADFHLRLSNVWDVTSGSIMWYRMLIGRHEVILPSNIYVMLADVHSNSVDWVQVSEINARNLTTALYYADLKADKYTIETIEVLSVEEADGTVAYPNTKNLLPVLVGEDRMILCSDRDSFVKTKNMNFTCLY